jgi:CheY-like chemotaxis protein
MDVMKRKILIVEDYEDAREFMKFLLQGYGYQVVEAADGFEAVECFKTNFPALVLMDMSMPVMDGIAAAKAIRKLKDGAVIPIIAITAHGKRFYDRAIEAGCNDLIEKPVDFDSLEAVLNQYLVS